MGIDGHRDHRDLGAIASLHGLDLGIRSEQEMPLAVQDGRVIEGTEGEPEFTDLRTEPDSTVGQG